MDVTLILSPDTQRIAGILLLAIVTIEFGGLYLLRIVRGKEPLTDFQKAFARAGHAHAGVLVTLALVGLLFYEATDIDGILSITARNGIAISAILMPAGFFFSSMGKNLTQPNRFILLLYAGAASLALGVASLGIGLLIT